MLVVFYGTSKSNTFVKVQYAGSNFVIRLKIEPSKVWHNWHCAPHLGIRVLYGTCIRLTTIQPYYHRFKKYIQGMELSGFWWTNSIGAKGKSMTNATFYANYCFHSFVPLRIVLLYFLFYSKDSPSIFQQAVINSDRFRDERSVCKVFLLYSSKFFNPSLKLPSHDALWYFSLW